MCLVPLAYPNASAFLVMLVRNYAVVSCGSLCFVVAFKLPSFPYLPRDVNAVVWFLFLSLFYWRRAIYNCLPSFDIMIIVLFCL